MRTTLHIADDVYQAAKAISESSGRPLSAVVSDLMRRGLRPVPPVSSGELPTFEVPDDAAMIPLSRAAGLLADEGLQ